MEKEEIYRRPWKRIEILGRNGLVVMKEALTTSSQSQSIPIGVRKF